MPPNALREQIETELDTLHRKGCSVRERNPKSRREIVALILRLMQEQLKERGRVVEQRPSEQVPDEHSAKRRQRRPA